MVTIEVPGNAPARVWATADWHLGHVDHAADLFAAHKRQAVDEGWHLIHAGDALEMVTPASRVARRGGLTDQRFPPEEQRWLLIDTLKQIRGRGVILPGNHEFRVDMATGLDFVRSVTDAVGDRIVPMERPGRVRFVVGDQAYDLYVHHGEGPFVSPITLFDRIQRDEDGLDAILAGHVHASTFDPALVGTPQGDRVVLRIRLGHYLRPPRYQVVRPVARRGAPGSWLLTLHARTHLIEAQWLT
jgi:hypothetical protein